MNIEKCDRQCLIPTFFLRIYETKRMKQYEILKNEQPKFKPRLSGDKHVKYHYHALSERI